MIPTFIIFIVDFRKIERLNSYGLLLPVEKINNQEKLRFCVLNISIHKNSLSNFSNINHENLDGNSEFGLYQQTSDSAANDKYDLYLK